MSRCNRLRVGTAQPNAANAVHNANVFVDNRELAKVDVATENKRDSVHAAAEYRDDAPLKFVPLSMGTLIS